VKSRIFPLLVVSISMVACAPDTLQSTFEKDQRNDGMDNINIIHIEENELYGLVVNTSWTEDYI